MQLALGGSSDAECSQGLGSLAADSEDFPLGSKLGTQKASMQARNTALGLGTRMKARGPSCKDLAIPQTPLGTHPFSVLVSELVLIPLQGLSVHMQRASSQRGLNVARGGLEDLPAAYTWS